MTVTTQESFKIFTIKQEKHHTIKLLAQTKLDSISEIISHARQNRDIGKNIFRAGKEVITRVYHKYIIK